MRILYITNNYTPYSGGVVSSINTATEGLSAEGHEIAIVSLNFLGQAHSDPCHIVRIPSWLRFNYKNNYMALPWRPNAYLQDYINDWHPDIIHIHHPFLLGPIAARIARKKNIPIVFTYHTLYEHYAHYVPAPARMTQFFIRYAVSSLLETVDGIIIPSPGMREYIPQSIQHKPLCIIPSAISPLLCKSHEQMQKTKRVTHSRFSLLVVSRLVQEKNIGLLIDLFAQLAHDKRFTLTIAGYGNLYDTLRNYAYEYYALSPEQLIFIHSPTKQQLSDLYQQADLFLFASQIDTQGLVLAESMANGTPVIALDGIGQRAIINNGYNGFIVPDITAMKDCIYGIAQSPELLGNLCKGALATAHDYNATTMAHNLCAFYNQIVSLYKRT